MRKFYLGATILVSLAVLATSSGVAMAKGGSNNPAIVIIDESGNTVKIDQFGSNNNVDANITNDSSTPVPVAVQGDVVTAQRQPVAASGTWQGAGLSIPSMILHDIIFYIEDNLGNPDCRFFMSFTTGQFTSSILHRRTLRAHAIITSYSTRA